LIEQKLSSSSPSFPMRAGIYSEFLPFDLFAYLELKDISRKLSKAM
jgi:hypothetical protein